MKKILILLVFVFLLGGCAKEETKTSYLQQFVTEDTSILTSYYANEEEVTKERVLWELENSIGFLEKEYDIKEPENAEPNQVYEIVTKDAEPDHFKVYYVNDTTIITADCGFIERAIEILHQKELELQDSIYTTIDWAMYICRYEVGKENIQQTDTESIKKVETHIKSVLPYVDFEEYTLEVS